MNPPITYYGGKTKMVKDIQSLYIQTGRYIEPFAGGASFFWHKQPSKLEVISDVNGMVTNFYRVLKSPRMFSYLVEMAEATIYSEYNWEEARFIYLHPAGYSKPERAWAFWMLFNFSFGGMGFNGAFQITTNSKDSWIPPVKLINKKEKLKYYGKRLERTMILNKCALTVIEKFDRKDSFFYLDPPYYQANQGHYKGYSFKNFKSLLDILSNLEGKFLLSSYNCELLQEYINKNKWNQKLIENNLSIKSNAKTKTESLVFNYPIETIKEYTEFNLF